MICAPEHGPHHAHGLCGSCHSVRWRAERRAMNPPPPRHRRALQLAARAERIRAELEAAGPYANRPATWRGVADELGVKHATLDRTLTRARRYRERAVA